MGLLAPLNPPLPAWQDARVWVIGASTGIGEAVARALLDRGATVILSARNEAKLREVAGGEAASGRAFIEALDFTDEALSGPAGSSTVPRFSRLDLLQRSIRCGLER